MISIRLVSDVTLKELFDRSPASEIPKGEELLLTCLQRSTDVRYGYVDNQCACVWGLIPPTLLSGSAYLWLLTTDLVEQHKFLFVRHSQRWIEEALQVYPTIIGDWIPGDPRSRRWLEWLGAEFAAFQGGRIPFVIRKKPNG
jgi:hypothetical protein